MSAALLTETFLSLQTVNTVNLLLIYAWEEKKVSILCLFTDEVKELQTDREM